MLKGCDFVRGTHSGKKKKGRKEKAANAFSLSKSKERIEPKKDDPSGNRYAKSPLRAQSLKEERRSQEEKSRILRKLAPRAERRKGKKGERKRSRDFRDSAAKGKGGGGRKKKRLNY